jgi:hypothetical protein
MNEMIEARTQTSKDRPYRTIEDGDDDDRYDNDGGDDVHYDDLFGDDDDVIEMY